MFLGRCARAGRMGVAYSLVAPDEQAYLLDLHLFLGRPMSIITLDNKEGTIGRAPQDLIEDQLGSLLVLHENHIDLVSKKSVFLRCLQFFGCSWLLKKQ